MAAKDNTPLHQREAAPVLMIAAVSVLVLAMGAGVYYTYNGGWKTTGQQEEQFKHEMLPIIAAKHGDTAALDAENKLRKEQGREPLVVPKEKGNTQSDPQALQKLQDQLRAHGAGQ
jgi:hypothetical protein